MQCRCNPEYIGGGDWYCSYEKAMKSAKQVERCEEKAEVTNNG